MKSFHNNSKTGALVEKGRLQEIHVPANLVSPTQASMDKSLAQQYPFQWQILSAI